MSQRKGVTRTAPGFTLVELLIVIVVIAILAAITIVAYGGVTQKATAAALQSDLTQSKSWLDGYFVQNGSYPADLPTAEAAGLKVNPPDNLVYIANNAANPATYALTASNGSQSYYVNNTSATKPTSGAWVQNLVLNPSIENGTANAVNIGNTTNRTVSAMASSTAESGGNVLHIVAGTAGVLGGYGAMTGQVPLGNYTASLWLRSSFAAFVELYMEGTATKSPYASQSITLTPNTWTRLSLSFAVTTAGTVNVGFLNGGTGGAVGDWIDMDAVMLVPRQVVGRVSSISKLGMVGSARPA